MRFNLIAELLSDNKKKNYYLQFNNTEHYEEVLCNFGSDAYCRVFH
jgi:hypothetical protein